MAPAIAFNALFAAIPLLLVAASVAAFVYGTNEGLERAYDAVALYAPQLHDLVANNLDAIVRYKGISGAIGLIALAWSGKNLFQALTYALNRSVGVQQYRFFIWDIIIALVLVPIAGVVLIVATALPVVITLIVQFAGLESLRWVPQIASYAGSSLLVFILCALLYAYLPNRRTTWPPVLVGALVTAVGYTLLQVAFAAYTTYAAYAFRVYGALSALFVLLLWLNYTGIVFLFGAFVSAAYERESETETEPLTTGLAS